jgi:cytochrome c-type biogenesis protein CcmH
MDMLFWFMVPLLAIVAVLFVTVPLLRKAAPNDGSVPTRGSEFGTAWLAVGLTAIVVIPSLALYAYLGRPNLAVHRANAIVIPDQAAAEQGSHASVSNMIKQLQAKVQQTPNDAGAWENLGRAFMHFGYPDQAEGPYKHAVVLAPDNVDDLSALTEATIQANDGKISAIALADLRRVISLAPADPRARFYLAMYKDQQGDHAGAVTGWIQLIKHAPPDAGWAPKVRRVAEAVAKEQHLNIAGQLPPEPAPATDTAPPMLGPSADQVAASQQMTPTDRNAMIHKMVDRLATQLKQNPHNADGWGRLMKARMVLGETAEAGAAYRAAQKAFFQEPLELAILEHVARDLGVPAG